MTRPILFCPWISVKMHATIDHVNNLASVELRNDGLDIYTLHLTIYNYVVIYLVWIYLDIGVYIYHKLLVNVHLTSYIFHFCLFIFSLEIIFSFCNPKTIRTTRPGYHRNVGYLKVISRQLDHFLCHILQIYKCVMRWWIV